MRIRGNRASSSKASCVGLAPESKKTEFISIHNQQHFLPRSHPFRPLAMPSTPYYYLPLIAELIPNWCYAGDEGKARIAGIVVVKSVEVPGAYDESDIAPVCSKSCCRTIFSKKS